MGFDLSHNPTWGIPAAGMACQGGMTSRPGILASSRHQSLQSYTAHDLATFQNSVYASIHSSYWHVGYQCSQQQCQPQAATSLSDRLFLQAESVLVFYAEGVCWPLIFTRNIF
jgi:hypothetical protein